MDSAALKPPRCSLFNLSTGESMECQFNPAQLTEKIAINWSRLDVPGLSHQILQYKNTSNRQLGGLDFYFDRYAAELAGGPSIMEFRKFLRAFTVPTKNAAGVASSAPPRLHFYWPNLLSMVCAVTSVEFAYAQFAGDGSAAVYTASVGVEEVLDVRVTSEDLRGED